MLGKINKLSPEWLFNCDTSDAITKPYQLTKRLAVFKDAYKALSLQESLHLVQKKIHGKTLAHFREFLLEKKFPLRKG